MPAVLNNNPVSDNPSQGGPVRSARDMPETDLSVTRQILRHAFETDAAFLLGVIRGQIKKQNVAAGYEIGEVALDVLSELFVEAMSVAHKFNTNLAPVPFLLGIAHFLVLRKGRERGDNGRRAAREISSSDLPHDDDGGGESAVQDGEIFDRVALAHREYSHAAPTTSLEKFDSAREILGLVSGDDAHILELSIIHGLDGETLAGVLGIRPAAARQRLCRALQRLRIAYSSSILNPAATTTAQLRGDFHD